MPGPSGAKEGRRDARPNLDVAPAVNVVLRSVASSLLKGDGSFTRLGIFGGWLWRGRTCGLPWRMRPRSET